MSTIFLKKDKTAQQPGFASWLILNKLIPETPPFLALEFDFNAKIHTFTDFGNVSFLDFF